MAKGQNARAVAERVSAERVTKEESRPAAPKPYRVLVADDHVVVRHGVRLLLESQPGIEVSWEASNGVDTVALVKKHKPDLVILDLTMPKLNGLEVLRDARAESPETEFVVLSMHFSEEVAREVLRHGARAYVLNPTPTPTSWPRSIMSAIISPFLPVALRIRWRNLS
jgi:DNA-binding NarL/FixJ family response regulator